MNTIFKIAQWVGSGIKWMLTSIMLLTLLICLVLLLGYRMLDKASPTSLGELQALTITVKTAVIGAPAQIITPVEYPTQFEIQGQLPEAVVASSPVKSGDVVEIYLQKVATQLLASKSAVIPPVMIGYGITLRNGEKLVDPNEILSGKTQRERQYTLYKVMSVPILYFLFLIIFSVVRRRSASSIKS